MRVKVRSVALLVSAVVLCFVGTVHAEVAIIVNRENPVDELSFRDVVRLFKQEKQHWETGKPIYLLLREPGTPEMSMMLRVVYGMREDHELKKFWLEMMFKEEIASFPQVLSSNEAMKRFVSRVPNAIGVIDVASVDDRVKVLRIEGKLPGEPGYRLVRMPVEPWVVASPPAPTGSINGQMFARYSP